MAEEISDDRFKGEVIRLLDTVIVKLGEHDKKFDTIDQRFENIDQRFNNLEKDVSEIKSDVKIFKRQFTDVVGMVLEDNKRITKLEKNVEDLQGNFH